MATQRKINLLQLIYGFGMGGGEAKLLELIKRLNRDKYNITIWENGKTTEGSFNIVKSKKYPNVRRELPNPAKIWYFISSFFINLIFSKDGSITLFPIILPLRGIDKNNEIKSVIRVPTKKQAIPNAYGFWINLTRIVVSIPTTIAAIIEEVKTSK